MLSRTHRMAALRLGALLMFLVLAGATYQGVATALERRTFPRSGGMVSVGDHQLHIHCTGEGAPTVVLEAPAAGMSAAWGAVQPAIERTTRVCSYDRSGLGWSERGDAPYDPATAVAELDALLDAAGEAGPYVVAGQGLGAALATAFAYRQSRDTAALVLVDDPAVARPQHPGLLIRYPGTLPWLARTGILRATGGLCAMTAEMPQPSGGALCAFLNRPDHLSRTADELSQWGATVALADGRPPGVTVPTTRLTVFGQDRVGFLTDAQAVPVVSAILEVVRRARAGEAGDATPDAP